MSVRISIFSLVVFGLLGFLTSCADLGPYKMDMTQIIESAKTSRDHNWIAEHYEDTAKDMQSKGNIRHIHRGFRSGETNKLLALITQLVMQHP